MFSVAEVLVSLLSALTCARISTTSQDTAVKLQIIRTMLSLSLARPSSHLPLPSFWFFSCFCLSASASSARPSVSDRAVSHSAAESFVMST